MYLYTCIFMTDMSNVTLRVFLERLYFYCSSLITQRPKLQLLKSPRMLRACSKGPLTSLYTPLQHAHTALGDGSVVTVLAIQEWGLEFGSPEHLSRVSMQPTCKSSHQRQTQDNSLEQAGWGHYKTNTTDKEKLWKDFPPWDREVQQLQL